MTAGPRDMQRKLQQADFQSVDTSMLDDLKDEIRTLRDELHKQKEQNNAAGIYTAEEVNDKINNAVVDAVKDVKSHYKRKIKEVTEENSIQELKKEVNNFKRKAVNLESKLDNSDRDKQHAQEKLKLLEHTLKNKDKEIHGLEKKAIQLEVSNNNFAVNNDKLESSNSQLQDNITELKEMLTSTTQKMESIMAATHEGIQIVDKDRPQMEEVYIDPSVDRKEIESHITIEDVSLKEKENMDDKVDKLKSLFGDKIPGGR